MVLINDDGEHDIPAYTIDRAELFKMLEAIFFAILLWIFCAIL